MACSAPTIPTSRQSWQVCAKCGRKPATSAAMSRCDAEEAVVMRALLPFFVTASLALSFGASAQDRSSHDHGGQSTIDGQWGRGHAENHDWYQDLKQPGTGYSCCNGSFN